MLIPRLGILSALVLGPRPPRAEALSAVVSGSSVTLSWAAPGLANLARFALLPGETGLQVPDVPPGTYFVRVRSANGTGEGIASNEVTVTVP